MARTGRMAIGVFALAAGMGTEGAAAAQSWEPGLILSNRWGNASHIGASEDLREGLDPRPIPGQEIAAEFKRLCLDTGLDSAAHARAALGSAWRFQRNAVQLSAKGKQPPFDFADYRSASAITSLWKGEGADVLKGRAIRAYSAHLVVTGPFSAKAHYSPQCNLSLRTSGLDEAATLAAALEQAIGAPAAKLALKASWADGHWKIAGPSGEMRRVTFDVMGMNKSAQLVHLTLQSLPVAKR